MDGCRDGRESNLMHFSLKMWNLVAKILMNFLIINWPNFVYLLVDPRFYPRLNFYEASRFVPPIGRMPLTDTADKETNRRTDASLCPSVRLLFVDSACWRTHGNASLTFLHIQINSTTNVVSSCNLQHAYYISSLLQQLCQLCRRSLYCTAAMQGFSSALLVFALHVIKIWNR